MQSKYIALAVMAACAGYAHAEDSGITISGFVRAGVLQYNGAANNAWGYTTNPAAVSTTNVAGRGQINFNGEENLGNGLSAIFQVNNRFSPTGSGYDEMGKQANTFASDDSFVGLKGSFGMIRAGKGTGNVEDGKFDYSVWAGPDNHLGWYGGVTGNNMVRYDLPGNLGGFYGGVQFSTDENKTSTSSGTNRYSVLAGFSGSNWTVSANYGASSNTTNSNATNINQLGSNRQLHLTANYKPIDALELAVEYQRNKLADDSVINATSLYAYYTIGNTQLGLQTGVRKDNSPQLVSGTEKYVNLLLHYSLSKHTMAYVELSHDKPQAGGSARNGELIGLSKSF
ncbi:porin [Aquitalea aquatica]|uniref:Porin n=1 Tax=Aquitalea aquatica TaxID=3044273 RepID=A0A838Y032_9NEIS|nr:porin [Aquitalea magnusonii]MBA4708810.1 porin [Aquitalea magnusonii]